VHRSVQPLVDRATYQRLLFLLAAIPLGAVWVTFLLAGWILIVVFAITPLVIPLLIGLGAIVGLFAATEVALANRLLGARLEPSGPRPRTAGFWARVVAVVRDRRLWKAQAYLLLRFLVGVPLAVALLSVLASSLRMIGLPIYYRWLGDDADVFGRNVDTLAEALLFVPAGCAALVLALYLVRPLAAGWKLLASRLLGGDASAEVKSPAPVRSHRHRRRALELHCLVSGGIGLFLVVIWALTTRAYFWPVWVLLPLALLLASHGWLVLLEERPAFWRRAGGSRALAVQVGLSALLFDYLVGIYAASGGGYFWPVWPLLGLAVAALAHAAFVFAARTRRIEALETTRAGAVNVQEDELRRIERDLHDGAQARLVALGISIGMAEQKLHTDPDAAQQLLAEARRGAGEALQELRDLARGIHPPVLTDRGLGPALTALAGRSALPVTVSVDVPERPAAPIETTAYYVVAEALANAAKHAEATRVTVRIRSTAGVLVAEIIDDGRGGADPSGGGLTGIRQRVEAFDGTLRVASPPGGPTRVSAELPCGS
jgi:signal transduction histidine kinase